MWWRMKKPGKTSELNKRTTWNTRKTTARTVHAQVFHVLVVDSRERQPAHGADHVQHTCNQNPTDQSNRKIIVQREREPLSAAPDAPVVRDERLQVVRGGWTA